MRETETWKDYNSCKKEFGKQAVCCLLLIKPKFTVTEFIDFKKWEYFYGIEVVSLFGPIKNLTKDVLHGKIFRGEGGHSFTAFRERPKRFLDALVRKDHLMKEKVGGKWVYEAQKGGL
jgi:hypothetical protein